MQIKGLIEKKETKVTDTWTRGSFKVGNLSLSTFDTEIIGKFNEGDFVEIEYEKTGKYNNIQTCKKVEGEKLATTTTPISTSNKASSNKISEGTTSMLTAYSKDILCSVIENRTEVAIDKLMPIITGAVIESYKKIAKEL